MTKLEFKTQDDVIDFIKQMDAFAKTHGLDWVNRHLDIPLRSSHTMTSDAVASAIDALRAIEHQNSMLNRLPFNLSARLPAAIERLIRLYSTGG